NDQVKPIVVDQSNTDNSMPVIHVRSVNAPAIKQRAMQSSLNTMPVRNKWRCALTMVSENCIQTTNRAGSPCGPWDQCVVGPPKSSDNLSQASAAHRQPKMTRI